MVHRDLRCGRIDVTQAPREFGDGSLFGQVGLAEEQAVGHRHLLDGLGVLRELAGAVRDIDPRTGFYFDDTKRYIEAADLNDAEKHQIYEGNARRVFPRLDARLKAKGL